MKESGRGAVLMLAPEVNVCVVLFVAMSPILLGVHPVKLDDSNPVLSVTEEGERLSVLLFELAVDVS
jgi:hypothetical protein